MKLMAPTSLFLFYSFIVTVVTALDILHYAQLGVCENPETEARRCVMSKSDCVPTYVDGVKNAGGENFLSAYRLNLKQETPCGCDEETEIGACIIAKDDGELSFRCAPHEGVCDLNKGETFGWVNNNIRSLGNKCTCGTYVQSQGQPDTLTLYGACQDTTNSNNHFCAYQESDCEGSHAWIKASSVKSVLGIDCHCRNVRVGGCLGGFNLNVGTGFMCAVTEHDCTTGTYFPPLTLKEVHGHSCRLCEDVTGQFPDPIEDEIDRTMVIGEPGSQPESGGATAQTGSSGGLAVGAIIGIVVGVVVFLAIVIGGLLVHRKNRKSDSSSTREKDADQTEENQEKQMENEGQMDTVGTIVEQETGEIKPIV